MTPSRTRLRQRLLIWWAAIVVLAVIVALVGRITRTSTPDGLTIGLTVVFFAIQLVVFVGIQSRYDSADHVGLMVGVWLVVSLAPLATYLGSVTSWWAPLAGATWAAAIAWLVDRALGPALDIQTNGIPARARVLDVQQPMMNLVINYAYLKRKLRVEVTLPDGTPPYEARCTGVFMIGNVPSVGDVFPVRVDPEHRQHVVLDTADADPPNNAPATARAAGFARRPGSDADLADRLTVLANMHASGALTDDEFRLAKDKLLRGE